MIQIQTIKHKEDGINNQFIVKSDEPVTIEFLESEKGHTIAFVYQGENVDSEAEPIGMYDSDAEPKSWVKND